MDGIVEKKEKYCPNWYYNRYINGKETIILDTYHPSVPGWPFLMQFYTICATYQKALVDRS